MNAICYVVGEVDLTWTKRIRLQSHQSKAPYPHGKPKRSIVERICSGIVLVTVGLILVNTFLDFDRSPFNVSSQAESGSAFGEGSKQLHWHSCGNRFECANLSVPLDWLNTDDTRTASIAITRYLASNRTNATDKGTIIFNPGGPGGSGTGSTWRIGPLLDEILQGQYDVLGFDPRGIKKTTPESELHDVGIWDAFEQLIAEECEENSGAGVLPFVNTPSVARDIAAIVDALHAERRHRVSYWGFSYGTNLGAIFTAMFPNKLHKVILDGIRSPLDAREIYEWGYTSLASQDDVM
ncbi:MAG: hypothetical protein LQ340_002756 [Diploschistes diacapsis]|nr:MAG: hypothetical protein LQ340_002756 [Diploschistes diacapsis]